MKNVNEISQYFGTSVSGFVANKFIVEMSALGFDNLKFYVKKFSSPYENLVFVEDIYISNSTLARPKSVLSVQSYYEVSFTVRMDPDNKIIKHLEQIFTTNHDSSTFEAVYRPKKFKLSVSVYGNGNTPVYERTFNDCFIYEMLSYDVDSSDRKLKDYEIKVTCNLGYNATSTKSLIPKSTAVPMVKCTQLKTRYNEAWRKYSEEFNKGIAPSENNGGRISANAVIKALEVSNLLGIMKTASAQQCSSVELKYDVSDYVYPTERAKVKEYASKIIGSENVTVRGG